MEREDRTRPPKRKAGDLQAISALPLSGIWLYQAARSQRLGPRADRPRPAGSRATNLASCFPGAGVAGTRDGAVDRGAHRLAAGDRSALVRVADAALYREAARQE